MLQLNPPLPLITPKGHGLAHFLIDYSVEYDLMWVVFLDDSGECWTFPNREIKIQKNITLGRNHVSEFSALRTLVPGLEPGPSRKVDLRADRREP